MIEPNYQRLSGDQARLLRELVREARAADVVLDEPAPSGGQPHGGQMILVAGAKGGVGTSTLSLRLAQALAAAGRETLLIDANLRQADMANLAGASLAGRRNLADVLAGACCTRDALLPLSERLSLLPGVWAPSSQVDATTTSVHRWITELSELAAAGDTLVIDAGAGLKPWTEPLWRAAAQVALVTTPDRIAVLDVYAAIKLAHGENIKPAMGLLVNRASGESAAAKVHDRVNDTCEKFLGEPIKLVGWAPDDHTIGGVELSPLAATAAAVWVEAIDQAPVPPLAGWAAGSAG